MPPTPAEQAPVAPLAALPPTLPARALRRIVILGGGTAGWMAAAPLAQRLARHPQRPCEVLLVESPEIGTVGVGEATLPTLAHYNRALGLDEAGFMRATQATFKLGIEFEDWRAPGERFFHGFGDYGPPILTRPAHLSWLHLQRQGGMAPLEDWSVASVMARAQRFQPPKDGPPSAHNAYRHAYHFDAGLYAAHLRAYAEQHGARRVAGTVAHVERRPEDGFVAALHLADGRRIEGDLFIDCSGFAGLLIEGTMQAGYEAWGGLLPCDRALAVPSARPAQLAPYTVSRARSAGWQWRIPLQHRSGNGLVYCSAFQSDEDAARELLAGLQTPALGDPRPLRFTTGRRRRMWVGNVVAVGLAAGFLEPLESTSIQLIIDGVGRLIQLLPDRDCEPALAAEFNRQGARQFAAVRDFLVMHYRLSGRRDTAFWRDVTAQPLPDELAHQVELYRRTGHITRFDEQGFGESSWLALLHGLGVQPEREDPMAGLVDGTALRQHFERLRTAIAQTVAAMPTHTDYVQRHVRADPPDRDLSPAPAPTPASVIPRALPA